MKRFALIALILIALCVGAAVAQTEPANAPQASGDNNIQVSQKAAENAATTIEQFTARRPADPRELAEAYISAVLAGKTRAAAGLATSTSGVNKAAASPTWMDEFRTSLPGVESLEIESVWSHDIAGSALAVSQRTSLTVGDQIGRSGRVVLHIASDGGGWVIQEVRHMFETDAEKVLARFHQQHPNSREIPPVRVPVAPARFKQRDDEARQAAKAYQQRLVNVGAESPEAINLKSALRKAVAAAFEARQQHQRAELARLRERFQRIQNLIESREQSKDEIINHRVEELLNPALRWDASNSERETDSLGAAPGKLSAYPVSNEPTELEGDWKLVNVDGPGISGFGAAKAKATGNTWLMDYGSEQVIARRIVIDSTALPKRIDWIEQRAEMLVTLRGLYRLDGDKLEIVWTKGDNSIRPVSFDARNAVVFTWERETVADARAETDRDTGSQDSPGSPSERSGAQPIVGELEIRRATELRSTIETLAENTRSYEEVLKHNPQADNIGNIARQLQTARRNLAIHQDELAAQIQLLQLELKDAESSAAAAAKDLERGRTLAQSGAVTQSVLTRVQRDSEAAQLRVDRLRTLLKLYRKAESPEKEQNDGDSTLNTPQPGQQKNDSPT